MREADEQYIMKESCLF